MTIENTNVSRRTLVKGAAWSLPVVAVAAATPLAAASTTANGVAWTDSSTSLLALRVLDSASVITATALVTVPTEFSITTGTATAGFSALAAQDATVSINVGRPAGINIPLGTARGFGVYSVDGVATAAGERTATYNQVLGANIGFPATTWTGTRSVTLPSNGTLAIPVEFGLAGTNSGISVSLLASFPVSLTVTLPGGTPLTASTTISVPVGAGIL